MLSSAFRLLAIIIFPAIIAGNQPADHERIPIPDGATLTGKITIEASAAKKRVYRGRAYRGGGAVETENKASSTPYKNTIVSAHPLSFNPDTKPLSEPVKIRQENATFIPHITPVTVGSTVQFVNDDPFYHNVFSLTPGAKFNIGRRPTGSVVSQKIPRITGKIEVEEIGEIELFCDIHSQMNAQILSLDTPYFIRADENGNYTLTDLPAGRYKIQAFNPNFETVSTEITLTENEQATQDFKLTS